MNRLYNIWKTLTVVCPGFNKFCSLRHDHLSIIFQVFFFFLSRHCVCGGATWSMIHWHRQVLKLRPFCKFSSVFLYNTLFKILLYGRSGCYKCKLVFNYGLTPTKLFMPSRRGIIIEHNACNYKFMRPPGLCANSREQENSCAAVMQCVNPCWW